jgi:hypothetical protein
VPGYADRLVDEKAVEAWLKPRSRSSPREDWDFRTEEEEGWESDRWREDDDLRSSSSLRRLLLVFEESSSVLSSDLPTKLFHILKQQTNQFGSIRVQF